MSIKPKHILVIRLSAMGDVAMTIPVLRAFSKQNPEVKLTVLTRPFFKPFFRDLKNVSVYAINLKAKHKGVLGLYRLSKELKQLKIEAIADLHNVLRTKILKRFFLGIPMMQIDKGRAEKKALIKGKLFKQLKTTHERYADVFKKLGYKIDLKNPSFPEKSALSNEAKKYLVTKKTKWIGIAPFAQYESKMYPLNLLEEVILNLSKKHTIILFGGGAKEIAILDEINSKYSNVISLAGKLTLDEELDVISNLDVMLAMDSGNGHIASMFGVPVVTVWGVTHPFIGFKPFNQPFENSLLPDRLKYPLIPTSVYGNTYPDSYVNASEGIPVKNIIEKIESLL